MDYEKREYTEPDANRDPLSGAPGSHPVGTGVGAVGGAATGAAVGAVGGPVGSLIGGALGAVLGGLAGKGVAEQVNPTVEDEYWRTNYRHRDYVNDEDYETLRPAYRYGWEQRMNHWGRSWEETENDLERGWENLEDKTELTWDRAKLATRDAWNRIESSVESAFDDDEDKYWRESYRTRPYVGDDDDYERFAPAYRYGWRSKLHRLDDKWDHVENDLERGWDEFKADSRLTWQEAKEATRDAWHRVERNLPGDFDNDGR